MPPLNLSALRALDTSELNIKHPVTGELTGWVWTIAGPGHPQTIAQSEKMQRENLLEARLKEEARVNGKKWRGDEKDPSEVRASNIANVAARVVGFTPVILEEGGPETTYSPETAQKILGDRDYGWVFSQVLEFLVDDAAFF